MGSRQGVDPGASLFAPKELLTVKKRLHFQRSGGICGVGETFLKFWKHPSLRERSSLCLGTGVATI